ncbi:hypothetical protein CIC12_23545 [Burkholderia sp. SG-MS1]|nr:hypothetical protein [Paraburkholderia sp. SG-MS1]
MAERAGFNEPVATKHALSTEQTGRPSGSTHMILMYGVIAERAKVIGRHRLERTFFGPVQTPHD